MSEKIKRTGVIQKRVVFVGCEKLKEDAVIWKDKICLQI